MQTRAAQQLLRHKQEGIAAVITRLKSNLSTQSHPPVSQKHAAVLVPLFEVRAEVVHLSQLEGTAFLYRRNCFKVQDPDGVVRVILTRRTKTLSSHSGEVALPGGKRDESDTDDIHTALREADEELGISPKTVEVLGVLKPFLSKHYLSVTPVIGRIPSLHVLHPNPDEVDAVFDFPLHSFLEKNAAYSSRDTEKASNHDIPYRLHYFQVETPVGSFLVWGLTAGILIEVAKVSLGRGPEFEENIPGSRPYTDIVYDGSKITFRDSNRDTEDAP